LGCGAPDLRVNAGAFFLGCLCFFLGGLDVFCFVVRVLCNSLGGGGVVGGGFFLFFAKVVGSGPLLVETQAAESLLSIFVFF